MICNVAAGPLSIPDPGTTWEFGYAFCAGIPVITVSLIGNTLNLMLAEACVGHVNDESELEGVLKEAREIVELGMAEQPDRWEDLQTRTCHDGDVE
jgi:nucleoside 2-deoxyribosyltransferase